MGLFRQPLFLAAAALALALAEALRRLAAARRRRELESFGQAATLGRLVASEPLRRRERAWGLRAAALALLCVALAAPQWGVEPLRGETLGAQVLFAVDVSLSMLAEDARPSRMEKARSELLGILDGLRGDRAGIIAFSGEAHVQCPLTTDLAAVRSLAGRLRPGEIPQPGTALGSAIELGARLLSRYPGHKALVLLTDGEDRRGSALEATRRAAEQGVRLFIIGVGTPEGGPIPLRDDSGSNTGYLKDSRGQVVVSRLEERGLVPLAAAAAGAYYRASPEESETAAVLRQIGGLDKTRLETSSANAYKNHYRLPLALAMLLLLASLLTAETPVLADRPRSSRTWREEDDPRGPLMPQGPGERRTAAPGLRQVAGSLLLLLLPFTSGCGGERGALDLWSGNRRYDGTDYARALERYARAQPRLPASPAPAFNAGAAGYKLGEFARAERGLSELLESGRAGPELRPKALYNLGNALFRQDKLREALEAYKRCLLLDPADDDCRYNLGRTLERLRRPPPKKQDKKPREGGGDKDKKPEDSKPDRSRPQSGLSREEAERVLQAVRERERGARQPQPAWRKQAPKGPEVDW